MKIIPKIGLLTVLAALAGLTACKKHRCDSTSPKIEFKDFIQLGDSGRLVINFEDCDGDIGLAPEDTAEPYDYNLFMRYFEMVNGEWVEQVLDPPFNFRIPVITPEGQTKKLEGEIEVTLEPYYYDPTYQGSIKYEVMLKDRELNESNRIETPELKVPG